ncbi:MAG: hypothetical protein LC649_02785 [Bacteroidales bacterium]|nr:hypothetical protein [Bacteroidales bacterium]
MKTPLLLLSVFLIAGPAHIFCQEPVEYPGAINKTPENNRQYLTRDSYEKVREFYVDIYNAPHHENNQGETVKTATFFYEKTIYEPRGIHISYLRGDSKAVKKVFSELKGLIVMNILDQDRYDEIEKKYIYLKDYYYRENKDEEVFNKYYKDLGAGGTEAVDQEKIMAEVQKLMMEGKIQEATALMGDMKESMVSSMEHAGGPEAIDSWIECLEEIDKLKYPVMIGIDR